MTAGGTDGFDERISDFKSRSLREIGVSKKIRCAPKIPFIYFLGMRSWRKLNRGSGHQRPNVLDVLSPSLFRGKTMRSQKTWTTSGAGRHNN